MGRLAGDLVDERALATSASLLNAYSQRVCGFRMEGNYAFGIGFTRRDPQSWMSVGIGVEAVQIQAPDLAAAWPDPTGDQAGGSLVGVGQGADAFDDGVEFRGPGGSGAPS
jgi:hypothetical protein